MYIHIFHVADAKQSFFTLKRTLPTILNNFLVLKGSVIFLNSKSERSPVFSFLMHLSRNNKQKHEVQKRILDQPMNSSWPSGLTPGQNGSLKPRASSITWRVRWNAVESGVKVGKCGEWNRDTFVRVRSKRLSSTVDYIVCVVERMLVTLHAKEPRA